MRDRLTSLVGIVVVAAIFIWNIPFLIIGGVFAGLVWLFSDLPNRKKRQQEFAMNIKKVISENKYVYLDYSRNHPFSEWLEADFIPKYKKHLIAPKYSTTDSTIDTELYNEILERAEHGGDDLYEGAYSEEDQIATLYVLIPDGSVTKWTSPMISDEVVNTRRTKLLFNKVLNESIQKNK